MSNRPSDFVPELDNARGCEALRLRAVYSRNWVVFRSVRENDEIAANREAATWGNLPLYCRAVYAV
jgi:hypothetical protein